MGGILKFPARFFKCFIVAGDFPAFSAFYHTRHRDTEGEEGVVSKAVSAY
jgi:hypothetical protein